MKNTALTILLAFATSAMAITGTVERIVIQAATDAELEETVLEPGLILYRVDEPKDVRIGDGSTRGGVRLWNYLALTNPPPVYDRDLDMAGHSIELNSHYRLRAEGGYLSIYHVGTNAVFRLVGSESAGTLGILGSVTVGSNVTITVQHVDGDDPPVLEGATDLAAPVWETIEHTMTRVSDVLVELTFPQPPLDTFTYYRVSTSVSEPMANFLVPLMVNGDPVLTEESPAFTGAVAKAEEAWGWGYHADAGYADESALDGFVPSSGGAFSTGYDGSVLEVARHPGGPFTTDDTYSMWAWGPARFGRTYNLGQQTNWLLTVGSEPHNTEYMRPKLHFVETKQGLLHSSNSVVYGSGGMIWNGMSHSGIGSISAGSIALSGSVVAPTGQVGTLTVTNALNVSGVVKSDIGGVGVVQIGSSSWGKINTPGTELFVNYDYPTKNMMFGKSGNSMLFRVFGKVGIGVALPVEALEVDGKIKATKINFSGCPTSTNGLVSGDVWNDGGALRIVP